MQPKLLRAIETQAFARVGGEKEVQVDVRILSANNRPLEALEEIERDYLRSLLTQTRGNISRAADQADITQRTLYNKLELYGMRREDFVPSE